LSKRTIFNIWSSHLRKSKLYTERQPRKPKDKNVIYNISLPTSQCPVVCNTTLSLQIAMVQTVIRQT
jgi:hypothetical protein